MRAPKENDPRREQAVESVAWFSILAHARRTDDYAEAARAKDKLEQLGVKVKWGRPREGVPA